MAKSKKVIRRRRRTRWASNIQELNVNQIPTPVGVWSGTATLATNPTQNILGVSNMFTVKNFDISFTIESNYPQRLEAITVYIMFVPQGMNVSENYNLDHPEYIMNYKYLGSPTRINNAVNGDNEIQQFQPYRVRTRLSRKLNTGDSVILFIKGTTQGPALETAPFLELSGLIRWWTKTN